MRLIDKVAQDMIHVLKSHNMSPHIYSLGYFGSGVYSDDVDDFDFMLITKDETMKDHEIETLIREIKSRVNGDYSKSAPRDCSVHPGFVEAIREFERSSLLEVDSGIGPARLEHSGTPWIHLNGPMSILAWRSYSEHFSIPATIMCNNFVLLAGHVPPNVKHTIDIVDVYEYINDMRKRFARVSISVSYCRKLIKSAALICGQKSCAISDCLMTLIESDFITSEESKSISDELNSLIPDIDYIKFTIDRVWDALLAEL